MRCQTCDKENAPSSSFCTNCGASLTKKTKPESTEGGRRVSILKWPEGALLNLG